MGSVEHDLRTYEREQVAVEQAQRFEGRAIEELTDEYLDEETSSLYQTQYGFIDALENTLDLRGACEIIAKQYFSKEKDDTALEYEPAFKALIRSWLTDSEVGRELVARRIFDLDDEADTSI